MSKPTDEVTVDREREDAIAASGTGSTDVDVGFEDATMDIEAGTPSVGTESDRGASSRSRFRPGGSKWFSVSAFLLATVALAIGFVFGGWALPFGAVGSAVGMFAAAFVIGTASEKRQYAEVGLAGLAVGALAPIVQAPISTALGVGLPTVVVGTGVGLAAGLLGAYFGRDLRTGLTKEV